jgi:subtilisin family serine protease
MRRLLLPITVAALVLAGAAPAAPGADSPRTGRLLVKLRGHGTSAPALAAAVAVRAGARRSGRDVPEIRLLTVRPRRGDTLAALRRRLLRDPRVVRVEAETRARPRLVPNDPALRMPETAPGTAPGTVREWWAFQAGFPTAWDLSRGSGARVAVIDSGIDRAHPDLSRRVTVSKSFDPDRPKADVDELGHGTHVASLACGTADDGRGMAGAGYRCSILNAKTDFEDSQVADAIVWATDEGADVINMSFGSDANTTPNAAVRDALRWAVRRGVVLVAAAADQPVEDQGHPANLLQPTNTGPNRAVGLGLSVTVATARDTAADFAGRGTQISLAAYGAYDGEVGPPGIFGAYPGGSTGFDLGDPMLGRPPCGCRTDLSGDKRYAYLEGTSMAAAIVSGAAALVRSLNPDLRARDVVRLLRDTAKRGGDGGWTRELGWGILDAGAAVTQAATIDRTAPTSKVNALPSRLRSRRLSVGYVARDDLRPRVTQSGVSLVEVFMRVDRGPLKRIATVRDGHRPRPVRLEPGHRYGFATRAIDAAGNVERRPRRPDESIVVVP